MINQQIVVAYDFTTTSEDALERAVEQVRRDSAQTLHFVFVLGENQTYIKADAVREDVVQRVQRLFKSHGVADVDFCVHCRIGKPDDEILHLAEEIGADLIIVGSHSRGAMGRLMLGSVSTSVLHGARCPVLIARPKGYSDVQLDKVVEVPHHKQRPRPHRYSYTSDIAQVKSNDWPI